MNLTIDECIRKLNKYSHLGKEILPNGRILIGRAPHIAPHAWLHSYGAGLTEEEIAELEYTLKIPIIPDFKVFLKESNGLDLFVTTFIIYGMRRNNARDLENSWQPFNILTPNIPERPKNAKKTYLFIGAYKWDHSYLYIDSDSMKVHFCSRFDATSLKEWENFEVMLDEEVSRIISLFDKDGVRIDSKHSTLPI